jgi:hypothetical protein
VGNIMKIIKKLLGLDKVEANIELANKMLAEAEAKQKLAEEAAVEAQQREELAKLTPKERATRKKEPWVGVLETHVNKDNVRNGFFELDWNELFVLKLRQEGYGADGDKDEEVVDRWFRELCANVVVDGDFGGVVTTGSLDPTTIQKNL